MIANFLRQNRWFFVPYGIVLVTILPVLLVTPKADLHLWLNAYHNRFFDGFFRIMTWMGDGLILSAAGLAFILFSFRTSFYVLSTYLGTGLLVQVLKRLVFPDVLRPVRYFQDAANLHLVDGLKMLTSRSFPSGHAASAFAFFLCLALIVRNHAFKFVCFMLALLVAYSRVYLSQHFLVDIYAGSVIGVLGALMLYWVFYRSDKAWHQLNVLSWIQKK